MSNPDLSTIAQLLYADDTPLDFARIVSELDTVLSRLCGDDVKIVWDCDDLVTFDIPRTRIVLGWTDRAAPRTGCLTVSVGPCPADAASGGHNDHDLLCSRLTDRIRGRYAPAAVLWCQAEGPVDAEVVDTLIDGLPGLANLLPPVDSILDSLSRADLHRSAQQIQVRRPKATRRLPKPATAPATVAIVANRQPDLPVQCNAELTRLRQALYPESPEEEPYSTQMRLAAHCMNATLILVWAPLGAAVMTYSVLKGENMALSSRIMAVSGTLFALAHSPVALTMAAVAKSVG